MIESLNGWSASAGSWAISNLLGTAVVLALVALVWLAIRKRSAAALGCWLFLLVLVKPLIPLQIAVPSSWLPFHGDSLPAEQVASVPVAENPIVIPETAAPVVAVAPAAPVVAEALAPAPVEEPAPTPSLTLQSYLLMVWAVVVAVLLLRFVWLQFKVVRWLRPASRLAAMESEVASLAAKLGLRRRVRVYSNPRVDTPLVCGLLRPSLMLPEGIGEQIDADQRRWVLLHELAHLKRGDLWVLAFQRLAQIVFFFNPSVWIANRAINRLREYACDDIALVHSKIDRRSCGEGFLRIVEDAHAQPVPGAAALALFERHSDSKRRLARILDSRRRLAAGLSLGGVVILSMLGIALLPGLRAQEPAVAVDESARDDVAAKADIPLEISLVVKADGKIYEAGDDERSIPEKQLATDLKKAKALNPKVKVKISADENVGFDRLIRLMNLVKVADISALTISNAKDMPRSKMETGRARSIETRTILIEGDTETEITVDLAEPRPVPAPPAITSGSAGTVGKFAPVAPAPAEDVPRFAPKEDAVEVPGLATDGRIRESATGIKRGLFDTKSPHRLAVAQPGIVKEVLVKRGEEVKKGQVLLKLDTRQAEAALKVAEIRVDALKRAHLIEQELFLEHIEALKAMVENGTVSKSQLDAKRSEASRSKTATDLAIAVAELDQAKVALEQFTVIAPVDGRIEMIAPKLGEYVSPQGPVIGLQAKVKRSRPRVVPAAGAGERLQPPAATEVPAPSTKP